MKYPLQPGNPDLTEHLAALTEDELHAYCDEIRRARGMPDEVKDHLLDDMVAVVGKSLLRDRSRG